MHRGLGHAIYRLYYSDDLPFFYSHLFWRVHINWNVELYFPHHGSCYNVPNVELQPLRYDNHE